MDKETLLSKRAEFEKQFNALESSKQSLVQQNRNINKKLGEIREEQVRLQGKYQVLTDLIGDKKSEVTGKKVEQKKQN